MVINTAHVAALGDNFEGKMDNLKQIVSIVDNDLFFLFACVKLPFTFRLIFIPRNSLQCRYIYMYDMHSRQPKTKLRLSLICFLI